MVETLEERHFVMRHRERMRYLYARDIYFRGGGRIGDAGDINQPALSVARAAL